MTRDEHERCLRLLRQCRDGNEMAYSMLTSLLGERYFYLVDGIARNDPAIGREDLEQEFRLGIWRAIDVVRDVGNPIYWIVRKGRWEVLQLVKNWRRRRLGTDAWTIGSLDALLAVGGLPEPVSEDLDYDPEYALLLAEERAQERVEAEALAHHVLADLTPRRREVWTWLLANVDDLEERGAGRRLAATLGVSEQRASKLRKRVIDKVVAYG